MSVKKDKKAATRRLLMSSAVAVFHEKGLHETRVSDIVARAGVAQGTFYYHFQSKEAVFQAIADEYLAHYGELFHQNARALFDNADGRSTITDLAGFLRQLFISCRDNIAIARLVFGEGAGSAGPYHEICQTVISRFISLIMAVLEQGRDKGLLRVEDPELTAAMIFGLFQRSMFYFILTKNEFDVDRVERGMMTFLLGGLEIQPDNR